MASPEGSRSMGRRFGRGRVPMRTVEGQGTGNIGVPQPTTKATLFPDYKTTRQWIKYNRERAEFIRDHPEVAAKVLPRLSDFERALMIYIPRLNYWEMKDRATYKLICAAAGTEEKLGVAAYYAQAHLKYKQTKEIVQLLQDPTDRAVAPVAGLLSDLNRDDRFADLETAGDWVM